MTSSNPGSNLLQIKDSTGKVVFAALLAGVTVTNEEASLTLQATSINVISVPDVVTGSEEVKTLDLSPEKSS